MPPGHAHHSPASRYATRSGPACRECDRDATAAYVARQQLFNRLNDIHTV